MNGWTFDKQIILTFVFMHFNNSYFWRLTTVCHVCQQGSMSGTSTLTIWAAWNEERFTTYLCSALLWRPSNEVAICVGQLFMNSLWWWSLAGEDLFGKTDGQEEKEGAIKLSKSCWPSFYGRQNYGCLEMLNIKGNHITSYSFFYLLFV